MLKVSELSKSFGNFKAVDNVSFDLRPGKVTGYLGPNGSGKSTTMKMMVGLQKKDHGSVLYDGRAYTELDNPSKTIGVHLGSPSFYPNISAENYLQLLAKGMGIDVDKVNVAMDMVGLSSAKKKKPKEFSLGMVQRLGLAGALLNQPKVLMLDEPANGLDPQSIHWLRDFLKDYAKQGNIVFVSSHLLSEMQLLADDIVIIAAGKVKSTGSMKDLIDKGSTKQVVVDSSKKTELKKILTAKGFVCATDEDKRLVVKGADTVDVGMISMNAKIPLSHLEQSKDTLEDIFISLTSDAQQYKAEGTKK